MNTKVDFRKDNAISLGIVRLALPADFWLFLEYNDLVTLGLECMGSAQASRSAANDADGVHVVAACTCPHMRAEQGNGESSRE